ncbi:MAG TPA: YhjD/YihY/BrkB family envelope integrity protein [Treponemataceae bacterium]|nr:YhjD/YihY/BrkB family envelope integrity protein [Treponemataceae bacterium]
MHEQKEKRTKPSPITAIQTIVLTFLYFVENNLYPYALACSFGLLYSAIPLVLLLVMILLRLLQSSPEIISQIIHYVGTFLDISPFENIISSFFTGLSSAHLFFEIFIAIIILWLARRFFSTTMGCVHRIFHTQSTQRPLWIQIVASIAEIVFVFAVALGIFFTSIIRSAFDSSFIHTFLPQLHKVIAPLATHVLPIAVVFFIVAALYHYGSGTHPKWRYCFLSSAACVGLFILTQMVFSITLNIERYNLIYGILAKTIIALFELSFFFTYFLFFAQMLFIIQFFDYLLLAELYLMPEYSDTSFLGGLHRMVFINPARFITPQNKTISRTKSNKHKTLFFSNGYTPTTEYYKTGDIIYKKGDKGRDVYYIAQGSVELYKENNIVIKDRGSSFGEKGYLLETEREDTAEAKTDTIILHISEQAFSELLTHNPSATRKALSVVSPYFSNIYPGK